MYPGDIPRAMWDAAHVRPVVTPMLDSMVGDVSTLLWILLGSVGLVLLIACANVANLFLVRGEARQLELAVRGALGSGIAGIVAQCLSESLVLAAAGGVIGVLFAIVGVSWAAGWADKMRVPRLEQVSIDGRVLLFAMAVCAVSTLLVSLIPLLRARRVPIAIVLRESGRGSTAGAERQRTRSALVVAQVALALVLVAGSGLLARSFTRLRNVQPGFDGHECVHDSTRAVGDDVSDMANRAVRFYGRLLEQVRALPGVREAAISDWVPLTSDHNDVVVQVEDHPLPPNDVARRSLRGDRRSRITSRRWAFRSSRARRSSRRTGIAARSASSSAKRSRIATGRAATRSARTFVRRSRAVVHDRRRGRKRALRRR